MFLLTSQGDMHDYKPHSYSSIFCHLICKNLNKLRKSLVNRVSPVLLLFRKQAAYLNAKRQVYQRRYRLFVALLGSLHLHHNPNFYLKVPFRVVKIIHYGLDLQSLSTLEQEDVQEAMRRYIYIY